MTSLLNRLQSLTGPDREVDAEIGRGLGVEPKRKNIYKRGHYLGGKPVLLRVEEEWPRYTESLDAALTLVPEGQRVEIWKAGATAPPGCPKFRAEVWPLLPSMACAVGHSDATPAIALLIAIEKAKEESKS